MGAPTVENFKHMLKTNLITDCPVTTKDVNVAEKIFGPDIGALKGRTTRLRPSVVREDEIEVPSERSKGEPQDSENPLCVKTRSKYQRNW